MDLSEVEAVLRQWGRWDRDWPEIKRLAGAYQSPAGKIIEREVEKGDVFQDLKGSDWVDEDLMLAVDQVYKQLPMKWQRLVFMVYRTEMGDKRVAGELGLTKGQFGVAMERVKGLFGDRLS